LFVIRSSLLTRMAPQTNFSEDFWRRGRGNRRENLR
jgi:hypothetical protein